MRLGALYFLFVFFGDCFLELKDGYSQAQSFLKLSVFLIFWWGGGVSGSFLRFFSLSAFCFPLVVGPPHYSSLSFFFPPPFPLVRSLLLLPCCASPLFPLLLVLLLLLLFFSSSALRACLFTVGTLSPADSSPKVLRSCLHS